MRNDQEYHDEGGRIRPNRAERRRLRQAEARATERKRRRKEAGLPAEVLTKTIMVMPSNRVERWLRLHLASVLTMLENNAAMTKALRGALARKRGRTPRQMLSLLRAEAHEVIERGAWARRNMRRLGIREIVCRCPGGVHTPANDGKCGGVDRLG